MISLKRNDKAFGVQLHVEVLWIGAGFQMRLFGDPQEDARVSLPRNMRV